VAGADDMQLGDANRRMWADPATVAFWRYWQYDWDHLVRAVNELIMAAANISSGQRILDLGSGHGEPALSLSQIVGPTGHVTATDLSAGLLALAVENAGIAGITNISFSVADAASLPFASATFDVVSSRFGAMFFADAPRACAEVLRVLRPGGRVAFAVWGAPHSVPWYAVAAEVLGKYVALPALDLLAPGPFRYGERGSLASVLAQAGLCDVREEMHEVTLEWSRPLSAFVSFIEALHCGLIAQVPERQHERIRAQLQAALRTFERAGVLRLPATVNIASGSRGY
jgi:enediyne biosynthesis protein CalE5